eukprot:GHVO01054204.1.p1 GENE.GHVO01054204.1~~GHVO01054204.1.p1  ORF type:complete len:135 (-),score=14.78 GHVO01054204.1:455-859(-)
MVPLYPIDIVHNICGYISISSVLLDYPIHRIPYMVTVVGGMICDIIHRPKTGSQFQTSTQCIRCAPPIGAHRTLSSYLASTKNPFLSVAYLLRPLSAEEFRQIRDKQVLAKHQLMPAETGSAFLWEANSNELRF